MNILFRTLLLCCFVSIISVVNAQEVSTLIQNYLTDEKSDLQLTKNDLQNWKISDQHVSAQTGMTHVYLVQTYNGIEVTAGTATFVINNGDVSLTGNRLIDNLDRLVKTTTSTLNEIDAINFAASELGLISPKSLKEIEQRNQYTKVFSAPSLSIEDIPVQLVYGLRENKELTLAWELNIYEASQDHWWNVQIDATTGELISKIDWVVSCSFGEHNHGNSELCPSTREEQVIMLPAPPPGTDQYNVFAIPTESPNHGPRTLVVGPSDANASPYGWHDDDGLPGYEYTTTEGNNVRATEDMNDNNGTGYFPSGGATLDFNFPLNLNQDPSNYLDPTITNLFYMNNIMHDIWYQYGFDEASGNFQENNYGGGGAGSDNVYAEAQDGGGTNNANFATPDDGSNPRMQMYLWSPTGGPTDVLTVNSPAGIAGTYSSANAGFGAAVPSIPITSDLVLFDDNTGVTYDACEAAINAAAMNGNIVVIMRGDCEFGFKVLAAENAGATAVIMINNVAGAPIEMGGGAVGGSVTIPSIMISDVNGAAILAQMASGTVNATIVNNGPFDIDGDFDNGIIAHEYGHGISNRLTGGPNNSSCLSNDEQMGEGWSDWFGLILTIEPGDLGTDGRGIGTFATGEPITGGGIRPSRYSTSFGINNSTYATSNNTGISQPHGIGYVWCTMIWDLSWALINEYGYDNDLYTGTGGNNIAMNLVTNGLKLQPCGPGFVDGRDAILEADQLLYGGIHECLIWTAFANRGLGYSADQGSANDRFDQVEAFDLPPSLDLLTTISACGNYLWAANGQTYSTTGIYMSALVGVGCADSAMLDLTIISGLNTAIVQNGTILTATAGLNYQWVDCDNNYTPIAGATSQSFNPTVSGNYAVILTGSGCTDTSACTVVLTTTSIIENDFGNAFQLYPNPTDGDVTIMLGAIEQFVEVVIYDISGREISRNNFIDVDSFELSIEGKSGMYLVEIATSSSKNARIKVQKAN
ncbi:MAG: extracellular elastinolytic metalloproteinase [Flavobacteriaceae bacterium]|jgi:extracellular elastinolytic metalloproteinase